MSLTKERVQAVINSEMRLNAPGETSTNFTYRFNRSFSRITEILIQSIQFPFSFYVITNNNNKLRVNRGTTNTITIPPGNYNATSMISILNLALNNATDPTTGFAYGGFPGETFAVTFSSVTLKFKITNGNAFTIFSEGTDPLSTMAKYLGFRSDVISTGTPQTATSNTAINLAGPQYITIRSNFLSAPTQHKPLYANNSYADVLFILPVNAGFGAFVTTDIQIPIRLSYKFTINNTDTIDIRVTDENGTLLDLNGNDWSMYLVLITE